MARCLGTTIYLLGIIMVLPQYVKTKQKTNNSPDAHVFSTRISSFNLFGAVTLPFFLSLDFLHLIFGDLSLNDFSYNQIEMDNI